MSGFINMNGGKEQRLWQSESELSIIIKYAKECIALDGDYAEFGVDAGGVIEQIIKAILPVKKSYHLFDTFECFADNIIMDEQEKELVEKAKTGEIIRLSQIVDALDKYKVPIHYHKGLFNETGKRFNTPLAFVHIDADLYASTKDANEIVIRNIIKGGIIIFHDYGHENIWTGVKRAIFEDYDLLNYEIIEIEHQAILKKE